MLKVFYKKLVKRFLCQSGEIILTTLVITGLVSLGVALYSVGKKSEQLKKELPAWEYADQQDSDEKVDLGRMSNKQKAEFVKFMVEEAGPAAVGVFDDTGLLTIIDKTGIFKVKKQDSRTSEENKEDTDIKEQLKQKNITNDKLMVDTAKVIKNQIIKNAKENTPQEDIYKLLYDTLIKVQEQADSIPVFQMLQMSLKSLKIFT
ncbi:MAG: hypothetical protein FJW56_02870 [Actinobacteria bacterium]|nr:hypothetical protein [Actinomycetota bacterium]